MCDWSIVFRVFGCAVFGRHTISTIFCSSHTYVYAVPSLYKREVSPPWCCHILGCNIQDWGHPALGTCVSKLVQLGVEVPIPRRSSNSVTGCVISHLPLEGPNHGSRVPAHEHIVPLPLRYHIPLWKTGQRPSRFPCQCQWKVPWVSTISVTTQLCRWLRVCKRWYIDARSP
jgi:hypothetical protein